MSRSATHGTTQTQVIHRLHDGGQLTVTSTPDPDDDTWILLGLLGAGPDHQVVIDGEIKVRRSTSLSTLTHVLTDTIAALATVDGATAGPRPRRRVRGPAQSHQPWTPDLEERLKAVWTSAHAQLGNEQLADALATALAVPRDQVAQLLGTPRASQRVDRIIEVIATVMGRSTVAITSRLKKLELDPDRPGTGPRIDSPGPP